MPTAFAGYSFHVAEAALVFANEIIVVFLFPIHAGLHRAYHLFTTLIHLGAAHFAPVHTCQLPVPSSQAEHIIFICTHDTEDLREFSH